MRQHYPIIVAIILLSCARPNADRETDNSSPPPVRKDATATPKPMATPDAMSTLDSNATRLGSHETTHYLTSTYDLPDNDLPRHQAALRELSDSSVFVTIHNQIISTLIQKHQDYFISNPGYELIYTCSGDLFQNDEEDNCFIVFDKNHSRVSILLYDAAQNKYSELFRDLKASNGLAATECNYKSSGTLDYQIAEELIYQRDYLIKSPLEEIANTRCKIADIRKDRDFVLEDGCIARTFSADKGIKTLCLPTSSVYNNWECLAYDKSKGEFIIVYGQAFAD